MDLIEIKEKRRLQREEAAKWLVELADQLARHNKLEFTDDGRRYTVDVPKDLEMEVEFEIDDDGASLEIELNW
ncbi:amphi-Trp domain-containing protein [Actinospongicola halichondriae]|uniref:amphi-Trp domain-containing protein n=1 Tax=Actinospongicola halichondriae TaxID=3236844 RepID=UPI003D4ED6D2